MAEQPRSPEAPETKSGGSWWSTLPGILTATAAVITAATGLLAILAQNGVFGEQNKPIATSSVEAPAAVKTGVGDKPAEAKASSPAVPKPAVATAAESDGAASGIAASPLHSMPFAGAIITRTDGSIVKLNDDIKEFCQGAPVLKTPDGQLIEMKRMARFDVLDWTVRSGVQTGTVKITLNNGEIIETKIDACAMRGTNDLGDYHGDFEKIRSVVFVR